ncbi:helix-turn-helix domain-containing protein [Cereibacter sp. SYSU M97828]|nr:helix-turn-helix domain-containing protein [Cereibacter flavus]
MKQHHKSAKVSDLAHHLRFSTDGTRRLLRREGIDPTSQHPLRYRWQDVWELEGLLLVASDDIETFIAPLLTVSDVQRRYFPDLSTRTITGQAASGRLPGIKIGSDWRFRESDMRRAVRDA